MQQGQCDYGRGEKKVEYYDYEKKSRIPYECPHQALTDKHYCEFHDNEYAQNNPDKVMNSFYTLVDYAVQNSEPLSCIGFHLPSKVDLANKEFKDTVYFSFATFTEGANFSSSNFKDEVKFDKSRFPSPKTGKDFKDNTISIKFDYSTFKERVQFIGDSNKQPLELGLVSFKGVDLSHIEFHNVGWLQPKRSFFPRYMIIESIVG